MTPRQATNATLRRYAASLTAARRLHALGTPGPEVAALLASATDRAAAELVAAEGGEG